MKWATYGVLVAALSLSSYAEFMDSAWAKKMCQAWNQNNTLTNELKEWAKNDKNRGYKIIRMYRSDCGKQTQVQLTIASKNNKAHCVYGGKADGKKLDLSVDYVMHANDKDWECIAKGSFGCGAMGAMMSGKLKFQGPKMEAMKVMGPFGEFLLLTGKIKDTKKGCPK